MLELQIDCEIMWTKSSLKTQKKNLYIYCLYNPKTIVLLSSRRHSNEQETAKIHFCLLEEILTIQDGIGKKKDPTANCLNTAVHDKLAVIHDDHGLEQLVEEPTRNNSTLDLMLTNFQANVFIVEVLSGVADHDAVFAEVDTRPVTNHQKPRKIPL